MAEYIIRETGYPGTLRAEIIGELVRCKDCRHSRKDDVYGTRWCQKPGSIRVVKDEFYCAYGERKE